MPTTSSAKKALRQTRRRSLRNAPRKRAYRDLMHQVGKLVAENRGAEARPLIAAAYKAIDKAAKDHVIPRNTAARKKSQLMRWVATR